MDYDQASVEMVRQALIITLKIAAPILAAGIVVGLVISLFQAVTSIQDQTLATVPKIVVMVLVAVVLASWIVQRLVEYSAVLLQLNGPHSPGT
jgi:flagellar biosynthesis protein FliQ